jgi:thiol-disulfide isomerase/thioredoxin
MVSLQAALVAMSLSGIGQTAMLDFYTDWCGHCRAMNPTIDALIAAGYPVQRVNGDQNRALAAQFGVRSYPCFVMVVNGREVDRVEGGTTFSRLERMCKMGASAASPPSSPALVAQNPAPAPWSPVQPTAFTAPITPPTFPPSSALSAPFEDRGSLPAASQPASDATLLAASVRIRVEDRDGNSCGSGTIIDGRNGEALVLTCGHLFRDSQGNGRITVDLFGPSGPQQVAGRLVSYDLTRDVGLVAIRPPSPVVAARVAPPGFRVERGQSVASVGCNNGEAPTVRHSQVTSLDKYQGPPTIEVAGQPAEGRSGGGLFSSEGYVLGVCNAADPSDREGLFAALGSIYAELDQDQFAFVYKSPSENPVGRPEGASLAAAGPVPPPAMPAPVSGLPELASVQAPAVGPSASLPPQEQAAMEEIRHRLKEGAEIVCIVRPRGNPDAKSEVIMLDRASPELLKQLVSEARRQDRPYPTSLEVPREQPKPRRILLEWSAPNGIPASNPASTSKLP